MVLNNKDLNMVTWEQRALAGDPKFEDSQDLPLFPYAEYARMLGLGGIKVTDPDQVGPAWAEALAADQPTLLEMVTDPDVPALPPSFSGKQALNYLSSLRRGDPDAKGTLIATAKQWWDGVFPVRGQRK
jgi:pyruvate dehydrogenase (quinone)